MSTLLSVELAYAEPGAQVLIPLSLPDGATLRDALAASGILTRFPHLDPATLKTGVFGKLKPLDAPLADHDRVELYRPLVADPKAARRRRVEKARRDGSVEGRKWTNRDAR
jgi:putative ubiquitin-RnfH superfamily antitoxin RatB of RatAB toxin-antitoxin module